MSKQRHPPIDAHRVAPKLWIGSRPQPWVDQHFAVVVLCAKELQNLRFPAKVHVIKAPLDDGPPPTATELRMAISAARTVHHFRKKGKRVLVTCAQGVNRSSFVAALALMLDGRPPNMAIHAIRENRKPPIGMTPLSNRHFVAELERLGRRRYAQNQPASAL